MQCNVLHPASRTCGRNHSQVRTSEHANQPELVWPKWSQSPLSQTLEQLGHLPTPTQHPDLSSHVVATSHICKRRLVLHHKAANESMPSLPPRQHGQVHSLGSWIWTRNLPMIGQRHFFFSLDIFTGKVFSSYDHVANLVIIGLLSWFTSMELYKCDKYSHEKLCTLGQLMFQCH